MPSSSSKQLLGNTKILGPSAPIPFPPFSGTTGTWTTSGSANIWTVDDDAECIKELNELIKTKKWFNKEFDGFYFYEDKHIAFQRFTASKIYEWQEDSIENFDFNPKVRKRLDFCLLEMVKPILDKYNVKEIIFRNYITSKYIRKDNNQKWNIDNSFKIKK